MLLLNSKKIALVGSEICPFSQRVLFSFYSLGIEFEFLEVDFVDKPDWMFKKYGQRTIPFLIIGDSTISGSLQIIKFIYCSKELSRKIYGNYFNEYLIKLPDRQHNLLRNLLVSENKNDLEVGMVLLYPELKLSNDIVFSNIEAFRKSTPIAAVFSPLLVLIRLVEDIYDVRILHGFDGLTKAEGYLKNLEAYKKISTPEIKEKLKVFIQSNNEYLKIRNIEMNHEFIS